jgi:hypothetical protein
MAGKIFINYRRDDSIGKLVGCTTGSRRLSAATSSLWMSTTFRPGPTSWRT